MNKFRGGVNRVVGIFKTFLKWRNFNKLIFFLQKYAGRKNLVEIKSYLKRFVEFIMQWKRFKTLLKVNTVIRFDLHVKS